jgi:hypothetical protein
MIPTFVAWLKEMAVLNEADTRYSVEVNFRTRLKEILDAAAKVTLGYASAALKKADLHVKQVFEEEPYRIMVSARNWDDGEWVVIASWNPQHNCYVITKGFYNKNNKSVSKQGSERCDAENAAEITSAVRNAMHNLRHTPDRHIEKLKRAPLKRGPKK